MNRTAFYAALRKRSNTLFGTSLSQGQVDGLNAILKAADGLDRRQAAYILATGHGETGGRMQAVRENLNYSAKNIKKHFGAHRRQGHTPEQLARNPRLLGNTVYGGEWGEKHLGNIKDSDGYDFRGWGIGQWTGRRNTEKAGKDVGLDLISNPSKLDDPDTNAELLVRWMMTGRATGNKLASYVSESKSNYVGARAVWGGVNAAKYAANSKLFEAALAEAGWPEKGKGLGKSREPIIDRRKSPTPTNSGGWLAALIKALFGGKK